MQALSYFQKSVAASALLHVVHKIDKELKIRYETGRVFDAEFCARTSDVLVNERDTLLEVIEALQA